MGEKLRLLLIDDLPRDYKNKAGKIELPPAMAEYFSVHWIRTPSEGREAFELFELIASRNARLLERVGVPSDLVIFDYALSQFVVSFARRDPDPTDIAESLRSLASKSGIKHVAPSSAVPPQIPGQDRMGLYIGVMFARAFAAYPCGAVPATAYPKLTNGDASFFEWFNDAFFSHEGASGFEDKKAPYDWDEVLPRALRTLRKRYLELARQKLVRVDPEVLRKFQTDPRECLETSLAVQTKFGIRDIPLKALFFDEIQLSSGAGFVDAARDWATEMLRFLKYEDPKLVYASEIARQRFMDAISAQSRARDELSKMISKKSLAHSDNARLTSLCELLGISFQSAVDAHEAIARGEPVPPFPKPEHVRIALKEQCKNDGRIVRWVALFLVAIFDAVSMDMPKEWDHLSLYHLLEPLPPKFQTAQDDSNIQANCDRMLERLGTGRGASGNLGLWIPDVREARLRDCPWCIQAESSAEKPLRQGCPECSSQRQGNSSCSWAHHIDPAGKKYSHGATEDELEKVEDYITFVLKRITKDGYAERRWKSPDWLTRSQR
jgi:hypothetical protein